MVGTSKMGLKGNSFRHYSSGRHPAYSAFSGNLDIDGFEFLDSYGHMSSNLNWNDSEGRIEMEGHNG